MVKFNEEIMKRVEQKERESAYLKRCLDVDICPVCGNNIRYVWHEKLYSCKCGFEHYK